MAFARGQGAVYALDAATGKLLWRRYVGFAARPSGGTPLPLPLDPKPGADVILIDGAAQAVLRLQAATGRCRWRHALGESVDAAPAVAEGRVLAYRRQLEAQASVVVINNEAAPREVALPLHGCWKSLLSGARHVAGEAGVTVCLEPYSGEILASEC